jgi:biopolymer transport protein TolQ
MDFISIANAAASAPVTNVDFSVLNAITSASWPVKITMAILIGMSVMSLATIAYKYKAFKLLQETNPAFEEAFWKSSSLDALYTESDKHPESSVSRVFRSGYQELKRLADASAKSQPSDTPARPMLSNIDNLERALQKAIDQEISRLDTRLGFLATTGSTGPFIGLFGTVWGIMGAFHKIGATNMANLAVVAPGISEALVATAVGLFAAIPSTMAYNHFSTLLQREEVRLKSFSSDLLNIAKRNFFRES